MHFLGYFSDYSITWLQVSIFSSWKTLGNTNNISIKVSTSSFNFSHLMREKLRQKQRLPSTRRGDASVKQKQFISLDQRKQEQVTNYSNHDLLHRLSQTRSRQSSHRVPIRQWGRIKGRTGSRCPLTHSAVRLRRWATDRTVTNTVHFYISSCDRWCVIVHLLGSHTASLSNTPSRQMLKVTEVSGNELLWTSSCWGDKRSVAKWTPPLQE